MLKAFRHKSVAKKVLWVVSGIIIISFGFGFGISRYADSDKMNSPAGKIFGKTVSFKEFHEQYLATRDQAILMHGPEVEKILPFMDINGETWTHLMLLKEADRRGIKASDREVIEFIAMTPFFQRHGQFDRKLYETILANIFKRAPRDFEESVRGQIKVMKLLQPATMRVALTDDMIKKEFERRNRKVKVSYLLLTPGAFSASMTADDTELKAYYEAHREDFLVPESINVRYITLALGEKPTSEERSAASSRAEEIYKKIKAGADFNAVAKQNSLMVKESGHFTMDAPALNLGWSLDVFQRLFEIKPNDILPPFETKGGVQIVKLAEKNVAYIPEFDKAKDAVKEKFLNEKALKLAEEKAASVQESLVKKIAAGTLFATALQELGYTAKETPFFGMGDYLPEIGISEDFESAAFDLTAEKNLSPVIKTAKGPAIIHFDEAKAADGKKFDEVKKDFTSTLYQEERTRAINAFVRDIRAKAKLEDYTEKLNKK